MAQRPTDGNIFDHLERAGIRRLEDDRAKAAAGPKSTGETRLNAAGPAFIAARHDVTFGVEWLKAETATAESSRGETSGAKTSGTESVELHFRRKRSSAEFVERRNLFCW